jgi:acyl-CoA synthetase (NDP forming)
MHETIQEAKKSKRNLLEPEALKLFSDYGLPVPPYEVARTATDAVRASEKFGYPVVLKVVSPQVVHKSEVGGVKIGLQTETEVKKAYDEIMDSVQKKVKDASVEGIIVRSHLPQGLECIVGMTKDPQFGPAIMFGLGGVFVELLKDVVFRVLPLTRTDAEYMIRETKGYELLRGIRGQKPKDIPAVVDCLLKTTTMIEENPEILEIDINPLTVFEKGAVILDAIVML